MERSAKNLRMLDELLDELLQLEPADRQARLSTLSAEDPAVARELSRLLALCGDPAQLLEAAGALHGALAQECLLGGEGPPSMPPGTRLGPYVIEDLLGRGGMSEVYRAARQFDGFSQAVALKILRSDRVGATLRERLLAEQRTLARLDHPNIARFLDAGISDRGDAYLAMELVDGEPVSDHAARTRASLRTRVGWVIDLCDALAHAHAQLVVHCDIKPSNVLIDRSGRPRLLDFGISRLLGEPAGKEGAHGLKLFTPDYAAPEQVAGAAVGTATDIFQAGALLYRLLVGRSWLGQHGTPAAYPSGRTGGAPVPTPSRGLLDLAEDESVRATASACGYRTPGALARQLRGDLDAIVAKCLANEPSKRYGTIDQLRRDLQAWLQDRPTSVLPATPWRRSGMWLRRNRRGAALAAAGLAAAIVIALVSVGRVGQEKLAKERERERALALEGFMGRVFEQASPYLKDPQGDPLGTLVQVGDALLQGDRGLDPVSRSRFSAVMARLELDIGRPARAEARARAALGAAAAAAVTDEGNRFELTRLLGLALAQQDRIDEGIAVLEEALSIEPGLPPDPRRRANLQTNLGELLRRQGRLPEAERLFEPAIASLLRETGALDRESLQSLLRCVLYLDMKGERGARIGAIAARIAAAGGAGESAPQKAGRLFALSYVESVAGAAAMSAMHADQAAGLYSDILGEVHPQVVKARSMACNSFRVAGELGRARLACQRALGSLVETGRSGSDDAWVLRLNLAGSALSSGDLVETRNLLAQIDAMGRTDVEPYQQLVSLMFRGQLELRRGNAGAALASLQAAAGIQAQTFPDNAELIANIAPQLARALTQLGRLAAADETLAGLEGTIDLSRLPGDLRGDHLLARAELALARGDMGGARDAAAQALASYRAAQGVSPLGRAWALLDVADVMAGIGEPDAARSLAREALETPLTPMETPGLWGRAVMRMQAAGQPVTDLAAVREAQATCVAHFGERSPRCGEGKD